MPDASGQKSAPDQMGYRILVAPLVFLVLGPFAGFFFLANGEIYGNFFFLILPFAYLVGGPFALVSGLSYSALCFCHQLLAPKRDLHFVVNVAFGSLAGLAGMMTWVLCFGGHALPSSTGEVEFFAIGVVAGAVCSVMTSALVLSKSSGGTSPTTQGADGLLKTALVSSHGNLSEPHGKCPKCEAVIPLAALVCSRCDAAFGSGASWKPRPLNGEEFAAVQELLGARSIEIGQTRLP